MKKEGQQDFERETSFEIEFIFVDNEWKKKFKFDFSYIESDNIKNLVKAYIWRNYKEGNSKNGIGILTLCTIDYEYIHYDKIE